MNAQTLAMMTGLVVTVTELLAKVGLVPRKWGGWACIGVTALVMYLWSLDNPIHPLDALMWGAGIASAATGAYLKGKEAIQKQLDKLQPEPEPGSAGNLEQP